MNATTSNVDDKFTGELAVSTPPLGGASDRNGSRLLPPPSVEAAMPTSAGIARAAGGGAGKGGTEAGAEEDDEPLLPEELHAVRVQLTCTLEPRQPTAASTTTGGDTPSTRPPPSPAPPPQPKRSFLLRTEALACPRPPEQLPGSASASKTVRTASDDLRAAQRRRRSLLGSINDDDVQDGLALEDLLRTGVVLMAKRSDTRSCVVRQTLGDFEVDQHRSAAANDAAPASERADLDRHRIVVGSVKVNAEAHVLLGKEEADEVAAELWVMQKLLEATAVSNKRRRHDLLASIEDGGGTSDNNNTSHNQSPQENDSIEGQYVAQFCEPCALCGTKKGSFGCACDRRREAERHARQMAEQAEEDRRNRVRQTELATALAQRYRLHALESHARDATSALRRLDALQKSLGQQHHTHQQQPSSSSYESKAPGDCVEFLCTVTVDEADRKRQKLTSTKRAPARSSSQPLRLRLQRTSGDAGSFRIDARRSTASSIVLRRLSSYAGGSFRIVTRAGFSVDDDGNGDRDSGDDSDEAGAAASVGGAAEIEDRVFSHSKGMRLKLKRGGDMLWALSPA